MNKKSQASIHVIVGILLLAGGISYIANQSGLGLILASLGLLVEAIVNWAAKIA
ncbi:MAG: hypothetical protein KKB21_04100 [Nanoarchaeota archaeon]|nr:hypothetical protein [Nanoarchaeota archaeon]MBU4086729.1 hypothetical protein [Nanoarchaeota archaeon]